MALAVLAVALAACSGNTEDGAAETQSAIEENQNTNEASRPNESNQTATDSTGDGRHKFLNTTCTGTSGGNFTSKITDTETTYAIFAPGGAAGYEIKPHGYFLIKGERAAVYAPVDMNLVQGSYYKEPENFLADNTYILHFAVGCDYAMFIDHITDPVDKIKAVMNAEPKEDTRMDSFFDNQVEFKAGELIGYTIGAGPKEANRSWDFGYYSAAVTNEYVNQERRIRSFAWKQLHAVCGFDYFPEPIKGEYFKLFTTRAGAPVPGAGCRSPNRDVAGTLSGSWFFQPDSMSVEPHVAIGGDIDGASLTIAGLKSKQYLSIGPGNPTYKDPATVTDRHCYTDDADTTNYFFFVIIDEMTLDLYEGVGGCPSEPKGTKLTLYR
ncbi:MAG: hypothetical protein EBZ46_04570 [Actinobacteria bacterium]|jgi:hypothetical protein|nr:hypothetical protein [Actinomycetota bacterium]NCW91558.1 hypothetical protein [Acidimicrobiia bacterium]NCZ89197.1 hypothetical protein [Actinomycetota bacterium]NDD61507.1 hypothetical protein [Actinomycetota bacterium]NDH37510.1 hypothetical protein [Acidimicrobiia bacterium]